MTFIPAAPNADGEVGLLEHVEVLGNGLPRYIKVRAQVARSLAVLAVERIEQFAPARVRECLERPVHGATQSVIWF